MKKLLKILFVLGILARPNLVISQGCNCYTEFNIGFGVASEMHIACLANFMFSAVSSYGGGLGGSARSAAAMYGVSQCNNVFYTTWDKLGGNFDACIRNCQQP